MKSSYQKLSIALLLILTTCFSSVVFSAPDVTKNTNGIQAYTLVSGGGIDDLSIRLKAAKNQYISAYCVHQCGNWFASDPESDGYRLKKKYKGAKVWAELSFERNNDRIIGPGDDATLYFIKKIKLESIR